jgi:hypothetical protein
MYFQKVIKRKTEKKKKQFFVGVLEVNDENSRIGSGSISLRHGSRSVPKCHGSATLLVCRPLNQIQCIILELKLPTFLDKRRIFNKI